MPCPSVVTEPPAWFSAARKQLLLTQSHLRAGSLVRDFSCLAIAWPLQTERYTRAVLANSLLEISVDRVEDLAHHHSGRLEFLIGTGAKLRFLLDEAVLHRCFEDHTIMLEQLRYLRHYSNDAVTIRILPFTAGAHPVMEWPMVIVEVNELHRCLYCQVGIEGYAELNTANVTTYSSAFDIAWGQALQHADGLRFLDERIRYFEEPKGTQCP